MENQQPPGFLYILISPENQPTERNPSSKTDVNVGQSRTPPSNASMAASASCPLLRGLNKNEERRWGCSLKLKLYDDPWKVKKILRKSDLGTSSRLLLATESVEKMILPVVGADAPAKIASESGIPVSFWDVDTESEHRMVLKQWCSAESYVLIGSWKREFVQRRSLKVGDEIGLHWDPYRKRFNFSVLKRFC